MLWHLLLLLLPNLQASLSYSSELGGECNWNDFKLVTVLGKGGHGFVTKAVHKTSGKNVAMKILSKDKESRHDLERESSIHASVHHPKVSRFLCMMKADSDGILDGRAFKRGDPVFVLELIQGSSLRDIMKKGKSFDPKAITKQLLDVLCYFRYNNIVFGDLSSGNIMLDSHGQVKLIDFGAALNVEPGDQEASPIFVSYKTRPHRWRNYAADWYALGLLIQEMLVCKESGSWRDQRNLRNKKCSEIIKTRHVCDLVKHLIPANKNWRSIWGTDATTEGAVHHHKWLS